MNARRRKNLPSRFELKRRLSVAAQLLEKTRLNFGKILQFKQARIIVTKFDTTRIQIITHVNLPSSRWFLP